MGQHRVPITAASSIPRQALPARARAALSAGRAARLASQTLGRGWAAGIGGGLALRLDPQITSRLAQGRSIALVTGTNGKSTTTRLLVKALATRGPVASNRSGSGGERVAVSALDRQRHADQAVLEVDELQLGALLQATRASVVILLNLSREPTPGRSPDLIRRHWREALDAVDWDCVVLANVDDPLVAWAARDTPGFVGVAAGLLWPQDALICPDCGARLRWSGPHWACADCGAARPLPDWAVDGDRVLHGPADPTPVRAALLGRAAAADALLAVVAAHTMGVPAPEAAGAVAAVDEVAGRHVAVAYGEHQIRLMVAKNPAGWREMIDLATTGASPVVFAVDSAGVDDTVSLWDAPAELLHGVSVAVAGARRFDVAGWLQTCGVEICAVEEDPFDAVQAFPPGDVVLAANAPAFASLRSRLSR